MSNLFSTYKLGNLTLNNRLVMAPMTRTRALNNTPNDLIATYYAQRASAGLIITEGTSPSPNGLGYARIPGIFNQAQIDGWKKVTKAVHDKGGKIFVQLMHTGAISHVDNLPQGARVLAPSAITLEATEIWVDDKGNLAAHPAQEMTLEDIRTAIDEHIQAARNAIAAGFDGVEIHGANGYLIKQFLNPHSNRRTDAYGGTAEKRARFLLEITEGIAAAIGKDKVGVRLSPYVTFNEKPLYPEVDAAYDYISRKLNDLDIAYVHLITAAAPAPLIQQIRRNFKNTLIVAGDLTKDKAEEALKNGADLAAFGKAFIANPDLVDRLQKNLPLNQPRFDLFYAPGAEGFTDYPVFHEVPVLN